MSGNAAVPMDVLDEAYRILATWSEVPTVPDAWSDRMAKAAENLRALGARDAFERVSP